MICAPIGRNQLRPAMTTRAVSATWLSFLPNPFGIVGQGSTLFNGNNTGTRVEIVDTKESFAQGGLSAGTGNFTMECWFNPTAVAASGEQYIFEQSYGGPVIFLNGNKFALGHSMNSVITTTTTVISISTWYHAAVSRSAGTSRLFLNGTQLWTTSSAINFTQTSTPSFTYLAGGINGGALSTLYRGYICEARISTIARYTANFTPPTAPFVNDPFTALLIHCNNVNGPAAITTDDNT